MEREFSARRSRATTKPLVNCPKVTFCRCGVCGRVVQLLDWQQSESPITCCGQTMEWLIPVAANTFPEVGLNYEIIGGYNDSAVRVSWNIEKPGCRPKWVYLHTFIGGYMKYVLPEKKPPLVFSLADEDAYAYCNESPCLECVFRCKRGFEIYAYIRNFGLIVLPLDRMNPYW